MEEQKNDTPDGITEKYIIGYEGHYSISKDGNVFSFKTGKKKELRKNIC